MLFYKRKEKVNLYKMTYITVSNIQLNIKKQYFHRMLQTGMQDKPSKRGMQQFRAWGQDRNEESLTPTYWMFLSHTHHHPFPGCPISRPKSARTEDREEGGQPQHKQKVGGNEQGELWAHSSASV